MKNTRILVEIGLLVAIAYILELLAGVYSRFIWPQGGSISASLVPLGIIAYRYGWKYGLVSGSVLGILQLLSGAYIIHPAQLVMDYLLPYTGAAGIMGLWSSRLKSTKINLRFSIWLSTFLASMFKFICNFLSGIIFFYIFTPEGMHIWLYSFIYNFPIQFFSWILSASILALIFNRLNNI